MGYVALDIPSSLDCNSHWQVASSKAFTKTEVLGPFSKLGTVKWNGESLKKMIFGILFMEKSAL